MFNNVFSPPYNTEPVKTYQFNVVDMEDNCVKVMRTGQKVLSAIQVILENIHRNERMQAKMRQFKASKRMYQGQLRQRRV